MTIVNYLETRTTVAINDVLAYEQDNGDMFASRDSVVEAIKAAGWFVDAGKNNAVKNQPENAEHVNLRARTASAPKPASTKPQAKVRRPQKTPAEHKPRSTRGDVRTPKSQNAHMHAMRKDLNYDTFGVGMMMHIFCYLPSNKGKAVMSMSRIADECGCSEATARRHMRTLVERGWFQRVDNGKGSVKGTKNNIATYKPTMPAWHRDANGCQ